MVFIDQGKFKAMKTLSGRRPPRCDKHQFRAKMTVSTQDIVVDHSGLNKKEYKNGTFMTAHFCIYLAVFHVAFGHLYESC